MISRFLFVFFWFLILISFSISGTEFVNIVQVHPDGEFACTNCSRRFHSRNTLTEHMRYVCGIKKPLKCVECDYRCVRKRDLYNHLHFRHRKTGPKTKCGNCNQIFDQINEYICHKAECLSPAKFDCQFCTKSYKQDFKLKLHLKKVHPLGPIKSEKWA